MLERLEAGIELGSPVLVADAEIVQAERCFVPHLLAERRPFIVREIGADRKIDQIREVADVFVPKCSACRVRVVRSRLAEYAAGHDRKRLSIEILGELEILHIAKPHRHAVAPDVKVLLANLHRSDRILPVVYILPDIGALTDTTAREPQEGRIHRAKRLHKILAQAIVRIALEILMRGGGGCLLRRAPDFLRHQRNHVDRRIPGECQLDLAEQRLLCRQDKALVFVPVSDIRKRYGDRIADRPVLCGEKPNLHRSIGIRLRPDGKPVTDPLFQIHRTGEGIVAEAVVIQLRSVRHLDIARVGFRIGKSQMLVQTALSAGRNLIHITEPVTQRLAHTSGRGAVLSAAEIIRIELELLK